MSVWGGEEARTFNVVRVCVKACVKASHGICPPFGFQTGLHMEGWEGLLQITTPPSPFDLGNKWILNATSPNPSIDVLPRTRTDLASKNN